MPKGSRAPTALDQHRESRYLMRCNKKYICGAVAVLFLLAAAGYGVGAYFVDFALKRGNAEDPLAIPPACERIQDKGRMIPKLPQAGREQWECISADGRKLVATHFLPETPGHRWAVLIHGYGRDQRYARDYAEAYLEQGWQVLTPDLCASGESEGRYITMGAKESGEIALWAQQIVERDPEAKIVLHGVSMGAATALLAAARDDCPQLIAVVEDCGYTSAYEMFGEQLGVLFGLPSFPILDCVDVVSGWKTGAKVSEAAPIEVIDRVKVPTLFIHGDADKLISPAMMERLFAASGAGKKEKLLVQGAGHGDAMKEAPEAYWKSIFGFLQGL